MALLRFFVVFLLGIGAAVGTYATGAADHLSHMGSIQSWFARPTDHLVLHINGESADSNCPARFAVDNRSGRRLFVLVSSVYGGNYGEPAYGGAVSGNPAYGPPSGEGPGYGPPDSPQNMAAPYTQGVPMPYQGAPPPYSQGAPGPYSQNAPDSRPMPGQYPPPYQSENPSARDSYRVDTMDRRPVDAETGDASVHPQSYQSNDNVPVVVHSGEEKLVGSGEDIADQQSNPNVGNGAAMMPPARCGAVVRLRLTDCATESGHVCAAAERASEGATRNDQEGEE